MDIVYVVRPGGNAELRYSLRSVCTNLPHERVWIVGHAPSFVTGVEHIPTVQAGTKHDNVWRNWMAASACPDISDEFVAMNDDMFIVEPIESVPVLHCGPLRERAQSRSDAYGQAMQRTAELIAGYVDTEPICYDLHTPMIVKNAAQWADVLKLCADDTRLLVKSIYGNLAGLDGTYSPDVKVHGNSKRTVAGPFVSTADASFGPGRIGTELRAMFPNPCKYEKAATR